MKIMFFTYTKNNAVQSEINVHQNLMNIQFQLHQKRYVKLKHIITVV